MNASELNPWYKIRYQLGYLKKKFSENNESSQWKNLSVPDIALSSKKLESYKNKFPQKRCFIIGNGPSINSQNLNLMKNDSVFVCNSFFLRIPELEFTPSFFLVEDRLVAEDNSEAISELKNITKFIPYDLKTILPLDENSLYIPFRRAYCHHSSHDFPYFLNKENNCFYWGGTVLYLAIQLAAYMGFEEIYLIGVDLTYKIPDHAKIKGSVITSFGDDPNHFDNRYFGHGKRWHLPEVDRMQKCFSKAYHELKKNDVKLFNATLGGNLQEIPRVNFQELF